MIAIETAPPRKPRCDLTGVAEGDAFGVILRVSRALDWAGLRAQSSAFWDLAMPRRSYGRALALARAYVEVIGLAEEPPGDDCPDDCPDQCPTHGHG